MPRLDHLFSYFPSAGRFSLGYTLLAYPHAPALAPFPFQFIPLSRSTLTWSKPRFHLFNRRMSICLHQVFSFDVHSLCVFSDRVLLDTLGC